MCRACCRYYTTHRAYPKKDAESSQGSQQNANSCTSNGPSSASSQSGYSEHRDGPRDSHSMSFFDFFVILHFFQTSSNILIISQTVILPATTQNPSHRWQHRICLPACTTSCIPFPIRVCSPRTPLLLHPFYPHPLTVLANAILSVSEEHPEIGDMLCQRIDRTIHEFPPSHSAPPGMMPMQLPPPPPMHYNPPPVQAAPGLVPGNGKGAVLHGVAQRRGRGTTETELCTKHNIPRSKRHLQQANMGGYECVLGYHCLEPSPTQTQDSAYDIPQGAVPPLQAIPQLEAQVPAGIPAS